MRNIDEDTITQAVIARHAQAGDARLRDVMTSLVQHLHAFAREVKLTEDEWFAGIRFLTDTGHMCNDQRQEFILLSDTLGLSMLVTAMNQRHAAGLHRSHGVRPVPRRERAGVRIGCRRGQRRTRRTLLRARPGACPGRRAGAWRRAAGLAGRRRRPLRRAAARTADGRSAPRARHAARGGQTAATTSRPSSPANTRCPPTARVGAC
jgi:hypothetical protein